MLRSMGVAGLCSAVWLGIAGCGASSASCVETPALFPESIVLDHAAAAPLNQTSYGIGEKVLRGQCAVPAHLLGVESLTVSDPKDVQIGSNGFVATVTCMAPTDGPVTVRSGTLTAQLTCR